MTLFTLTITVRLWARQSGLKWYPASLADRLALFQNANTLKSFAKLELVGSHQAMKGKGFGNVRFRLGYWDVTGKVWYGVGIIPQLQGQDVQTSAIDSAGHKNSIEEVCLCGGSECEQYPYRYYAIRTTASFVFWITIVTCSIILILYALASGTVQSGFSVPPLKSNNNLKYTIVFIILPTFVAGQLVNLFISINIIHSFIQPFVGMHGTPGSASDTILLEYATPQVILTAYQNKHYKVAWFCFLSSVSPIFSILVAGILTTTFTETGTHLHFGKLLLSCVLGSLVVYAVSMFYAWPMRSSKLPRFVLWFTDLIAMCHASQFFRRKCFDISDPKTTKVHMVARIVLQEDLYSLGVYRGRDEKNHLGFDVAGLEEKLVQNGPCKVPMVSRSMFRKRRHTPETAEDGDC